jgi:hypothetical protein
MPSSFCTKKGSDHANQLNVDKKQLKLMLKMILTQHHLDIANHNPGPDVFEVTVVRDKPIGLEAVSGMW